MKANAIMHKLGYRGLSIVTLCAAFFLAESSFVSASSQALFNVSRGSEPESRSANTVITDEVSAFAADVLREQGVRGLALGVVRQDGVVELGAWGNSTESGDAVTADTLFGIGSCTKAFLVASLGILMDDFASGRNSTPLPSPLATFDWETKVKDLLPNDWELHDQWQDEKASVHDILAHVSGLVGHDFSYRPDDTPKDIVRRLRYHVTPFELRQKFAYNNEMYITASLILTTYSGQSFREFVTERIFVPLGMNATTMSTDAAAASGELSQTWSSAGSRRIPFWFPEEVMLTISGAGAILSSVRDMTKWLALLLNEGVNPLTNATIIPKLAFQASTTASVIVSGVGNVGGVSIIGYGMGWMRASVLGHEIVTHTGGMPGFLSLVQFLPHAKLGMVSLTNTDGGAMANALVTGRIISDVLELGPVNIKEDTPVHGPATGGNATSPAASETSQVALNLSLPLQEYAGTYTSPDYGNITLCASLPSDSTRNMTASSTDYCSSLLHDFSLVDTAQGQTQFSKTPQLLASWPRVWSTHLRLAHVNGDTFTFKPVTLFPHGFGDDVSPFAYTMEVGPTTAHFVLGGKSGETGGSDSSSVLGEGRKVLGFSACGLLRDAESAQGYCMTGVGAKPGTRVWFVKSKL